jgi:23S rRNA (cytosine1962-C5)-methyltransferase
LLVKHAGGDFPLFPEGVREFHVLNTFAYTCGFSVCAAAAGAKTTSLDLSKKYLEWGRDNFRLNGLDPQAHDFIYGDVFDWLKRLGKKNRLFDLVVLDPPTFSSSKESGIFRAEKDYGTLAQAAIAVLRPGGVLLASTNAARLEPESFVRSVQDAASKRGRKVVQQRYFPQPPDFPVSREEPAYLKTAWFKFG